MFTFIKNLFGSPSFEQQMEKQMKVFVKINKGLTILKEKAISEKQKNHAEMTRLSARNSHIEKFETGLNEKN